MITAALMAGGKSTRMGCDKCHITVNGVPLWHRQVEILLALSSEVFVLTPVRPHWLPRRVEWIPDVVRDEGPIGGLAAALAHASHRNVLVLAVDMPAMTRDFLKKLSRMADRHGGIVPQIGERYEPLAAIYPRKALSVVMDQLFVKREKSLHALLDRLIENGLLRSVTVPSSEQHLFRNLNFPSDLIPNLNEGGAAIRLPYS
jgi:molybdopterin-guanine dinucleotide biosynthesis protein A